MKSPFYARIAARLIAREAVTELETSAEKRARAIDVISGALAAKRRRRARRTWASVACAAAVGSLLGYGGLRELARRTRAPDVQQVSAIARPQGNGAALVSAAGATPLLAAASLAPGGRLLAGKDGGATVRLSTGTELAIAHDTSVEFESAGPVERFSLTAGELHARVAKLHAGDRFIVQTPDAEVEVRGTVFRVAIVDPDPSCGAGNRTRVSVSEGVVEVRSAGLTSAVHPGEVWPAGCSTPLPVPANGPTASPTRKPATGRSERRASAIVSTEPQTGSAASTKEASAIARQNELFADASSAHRRGDDAQAIATFELLIGRYPASPLAESAAVQRINLLRPQNLARAREAARQYLVRYPQGYARIDAERLLAEP